MSFKEWESVFKDVADELEDEYQDSWAIEFDDTIVPEEPAQDWRQYISGAFAR